MNLFLLGWQVPLDTVEPARAAFAALADIYPQLDASTCTHTYAREVGIFLSTMQHADAAVSPRRYLFSENGETTFYDGVAIDRTDSFAAYDAGELARYWADLPKKLEGHFVAVRVRTSPATIELMTDLLGIQQVYYCRRGNMWLISNSARPLVQLGDADQFDPLGVSMFVSQTYVWGDRTLREGVRTIPAASMWYFKVGQSEPTKTTYCPLSSLVAPRKRRLEHVELEHCAEQLTQLCRILHRTWNPLRCAITGGRDSRLVLSFLVHDNISAVYHTTGDASSKDAQIAGRITGMFNLPHRIITMTNEGILERWDKICRQLIRQGNGMISFWQLANALEQPQYIDRLEVSLSGMGGEMARAPLFSPLRALQKHRFDELVQMSIDTRIYNFGGLVRPEARRLVVDYMRKTMAQLFDEGLSGLDIINAIYPIARVGRWGGSNRCLFNPTVDMFALLCSRPWIEASFALPSMLRYGEWPHRRLLEVLAPKLAQTPFDKGSWPPRWPAVYVLKWILERSLNKARRWSRRLRTPPQRRSPGPVAFDQVAWMEAKRNWMRDVCLQQHNSVLWDFVNRPMFEKIMSDSTEADTRKAYRLAIYVIVTMFYYAADGFD